MKYHLIIAFAAALMLAGCSAPHKEPTPVYMWQRISTRTNMDTLQQNYRFWKSKGVTGVCIETMNMDQISEAAARAHAEGLEYHAWIPSMLRRGLPHEWYAVNRLGQSADDNPAYVRSYRFLDPANPSVQEFLMNLYVEVAKLPDVDYVRLDFIRYPDVMLSRGLWDLYGLETPTEYAPADYCYCDYCTQLFFEQTGIDIKSVEDPSTVRQWAQFRCDQITLFVDKIARAVHEQGKKVSVDVFPGPSSYAEHMVRQQWNQWMVDMFFPMNYNDFYEEGPEWVGTVVEEEVQAAGHVPVMSGLRICHDWRNKNDETSIRVTGLTPSELITAVQGSLQAGATGVCLFDASRMSPEHWDALVQALQTKE